MLSEKLKKKNPVYKMGFYFSSFLRLVTDFPPIPQLSESTSSITTTVVFGFNLTHQPAIESHLESIAPFFQR